MAVIIKRFFFNEILFSMKFKNRIDSLIYLTLVKICEALFYPAWGRVRTVGIFGPIEHLFLKFNYM